MKCPTLMSPGIWAQKAACGSESEPRLLVYHLNIILYEPMYA